MLIAKQRSIQSSNRRKLSRRQLSGRAFPGSSLKGQAFYSGGHLLKGQAFYEKPVDLIFLCGSAALREPFLMMLYGQAFHDVGPYKECFETAGDTTQQLLAQKWLTQSRRDAEF